jgi:hypothetical protein
MKDKINALRKEAEEIRACLGAKLKEIFDLENSCQHTWTEPKLVHDVVNYDCGSYGGSYGSRKWQRECTECGKVDWTMREAMQPVPIFGEDANAGKIAISLPHG